MKAPFTAIASLALATAAPAVTVIDDHFDDATLDPAWNVTFANATGWTFAEAGTQLTVTDITAPVTNQWNWVFLQQSVSPLGDFDLTMALSWDSAGSTNPIQDLGITLSDAGATPVAFGGYTDAWIATRGQFGFASESGTVHASGPNSLPFAGSGIVRISRTAGTITYRWNGVAFGTSNNSNPVTDIQVRFGFFPGSQAPFGSTFFGTESVDQIQLLGTPIPEPSRALLALAALSVIAARRRR